MFSAITFEPRTGGTITFKTAKLPVGSLSWRYETASEEQPMQDHSGQSETPAPVRKMILTMVGQFVGDTATDYWATRTPVTAGLLPAQGSVTAGYATGTLNVTPEGGTAVYSAAVVVTALDLPLEPGVEDSETTPRSSGYVASMRCNFGYWQHGGSAVAL